MGQHRILAGQHHRGAAIRHRGQQIAPAIPGENRRDRQIHPLRQPFDLGPDRREAPLRGLRQPCHPRGMAGGIDLGPQRVGQQVPVDGSAPCAPERRAQVSRRPPDTLPA